MRLHALKPAKQAPKRVGRGMGSGSGKTAGRGTKGQKSRTGHHMMPRYFEGGQMALTQRIPKLRGFRNPAGFRAATVTTGQLAGLPGTTVDLTIVKAAGLIDRRARRLAVIAGEKPAKKYSVTADRVTRQAEKLITTAGGTVKILEPEPAKKPAKSEAVDA